MKTKILVSYYSLDSGFQIHRVYLESSFAQAERDLKLMESTHSGKEFELIECDDVYGLSNPFPTNAITDKLAILFNHLEHVDDEEGSGMVEDIIQDLAYRRTLTKQEKHLQMEDKQEKPLPFGEWCRVNYNLFLVELKPENLQEFFDKYQEYLKTFEG